jgi:hypothetical protein
LVVSILFKVLESAHLSINDKVEGRFVGKINELLEAVGVLLGDDSVIDQVSESLLEDVLSIMLPDSSEVRFVRNLLGDLMGVDQVVLGHEFGDHLAHDVPLLLEFSPALFSGGVETEDELLVLISMGERVEGLLGVVEVTTVSEPGGVGHFVVEES